MEDAVSPAYRSEVVWVLVVASGVLAIGTASIDARRVPLLLVPLSFLLAAYGTGTCLARVYGEIDRPALCPASRLVIRLGVGIAGLSFVVAVTAMCGGLWFAPVVILPCVAVGSWSLVQTVRNLARIIHEGFYCNRRDAAPTSLHAALWRAGGVLTARSVDTLSQVCLPPSRLCLPVSQGVSTVS